MSPIACCVVWPASDLLHATEAAARAGLHAKRMRLVHPLPDRPASRALLEFKAGRARGLRIEPPLFLCERPGTPSREALDITGALR